MTTIVGTRPDGRMARERGEAAGRDPKARLCAAVLLATTALAAWTLPAGPARAQVDVSWTGTSSDDWTDAGNWDTGTAPALGETVELGSTAPNPTVLGVGGARFGSAGNLWIGRLSTGSLTIRNASTLSTAGNFTVVGQSAGSSGTLVIEGGGTFHSINNFVRIGEFAGSVGQVTVVGTSSHWTATVFDDLSVGYEGSGTLNIRQGGRVTLDGPVWVARQAGSTGTLNIDSGGTLEAEKLNGGSGSAQVTVDDGTLRARGDGTLVSGFDGTEFQIAAGGLTIDDAGFDILADSVFSGPGGLTKTGAGTLTLTGASTYSGGTTVGSGTLALGSATAGGSLVGTVTVTDSGVLDLVNSDTSGITEISNAGITTFRNDSGAGSTTVTTASGGITRFLDGSSGDQARFVTEGTLDISSLATAGTTAGSIAGGGDYFLGSKTLVVGSDGLDTTVSGTISDCGAGGTACSAAGATGGALVKTGAGTLTLTGANSYSGPTTVDEGLLVVNGSLASSATTVNAGGALAGSGTIGSVILNGGTLAPGNSIGTMSVVGDVDFSGGGVYRVEVNAAGATDLIEASGTATLTGGSVVVLPEMGDYAARTDYTILTADGGLVGTFESVASTLAFLEPTLDYLGNDVVLTLTRNSVGFAEVAATPNQAAVGGTLDALAGTAALDDLFADLLVLTDEGARQALDSLSGVQHAHAQTLALDAQRRFQGLLFDRLGGGPTAGGGSMAGGMTLAFVGEPRLQQLAALSAAAADGGSGAGASGAGDAIGRGAWISGIGGFGEIEQTDNASGADYRSGGVAAGLDAEVAPGLTLGIALGYLRTDADTADGSLEIDSYRLAAYGGWEREASYLRGAAGFGYHGIDASRGVTVGAFGATATADYGAWDLGAGLEAGHRFSLGERLGLTPFAGLEYAHLRRDGFTEEGAGAANLTVDEEKQDRLSSSLGLRLSRAFELEDGTVIRPVVEAAWVRRYLDDEPRLTAGFAAAPAPAFTVAGPDPDRDRARIGAGVSAELTGSLTLDAGYSGEIAGSDSSHSFAAALRLRF